MVRRYMRSGYWATKTIPSAPGVRSKSSRSGPGAWHSFPKTLDEVDEISRQVAHDIRNQYTIGYKPTNPRASGGFRTIRVEAKGKGHGKLMVRTKSGYYAGVQPAASGTK